MKEALYLLKVKVSLSGGYVKFRVTPFPPRRGGEIRRWHAPDKIIFLVCNRINLRGMPSKV